MPKSNSKRRSLRDGRSMPFSWFSNKTYDDRHFARMGGNASLVYIALIRCANGKGECFPSFESISEHMGISRSSVIRGIKTLIKLGYIQKIKTGGPGNGSNVYLVNEASSVASPSVTETPQPEENPSVTETLDGVTEIPDLVSQRHPKKTNKKKGNQGGCDAPPNGYASTPKETEKSATSKAEHPGKSKSLRLGDRDVSFADINPYFWRVLLEGAGTRLGEHRELNEPVFLNPTNGGIYPLLERSHELSAFEWEDKIFTPWIVPPEFWYCLMSGQRPQLIRDRDGTLGIFSPRTGECFFIEGSAPCLT